MPLIDTKDSLKKRKRHIIKRVTWRICTLFLTIECPPGRACYCYGDKENSPIFIGVQEIKMDR